MQMRNKQQVLSVSAHRRRHLVAHNNKEESIRVPILCACEDVDSCPQDSDNDAHSDAMLRVCENVHNFSYLPHLAHGLEELPGQFAVQRQSAGAIGSHCVLQQACTQVKSVFCQFWLRFLALLCPWGIGIAVGEQGHMPQRGAMVVRFFEFSIEGGREFQGKWDERRPRQFAATPHSRTTGCSWWLRRACRYGSFSVLCANNLVLVQNIIYMPKRRSATPQYHGNTGVHHIMYNMITWVYIFVQLVVVDWWGRKIRFVGYCIFY